MAEYRELQAAIDAIIAMERHDFEEDHFPDAEYAYNDGLIAAMNAVAAVPAADVAPIVHAHWIWGKQILNRQVCSHCSASFDSLENDRYCPNCGAKMDECEGEDNV